MTKEHLSVINIALCLNGLSYLGYSIIGILFFLFSIQIDIQAVQLLDCFACFFFLRKAFVEYKIWLENWQIRKRILKELS